MLSANVDNYGIPAVTTFVSFFEEALDVASAVKPTASIEPPLEESDLEDVLSRLPITPETAELQEGSGSRQKNSQAFAIIETAARGLVGNLIANTPIDSKDFVKVWNLFDILNILSDRGKCDAALVLWLVEELLDSQTIPGCRKIFDYLESRRQRIISKHFADKKLVILRSCNELLRRLSRAEDTAFSGRVFIFLFQSFPLGDKSSVNLRGEYHVQNVTTWDENITKEGNSPGHMEIDSPANGTKTKQSSSKSLDPDALYPVFWSLQDSFNQPKKMFDASYFSQFKSGLEATMTAFKAIETNHDNKSSKLVDEVRRGTKRKRDSDEDDVVNVFNPKYLTSRDLFELEISDLSFRRYVLVQALIIMDFLLSLSPKAKDKLAKVNQLNKSVAYLDYVLSEEDTKWATEMKTTISDYLRSGHEGQFFFRMVETVLSRDKNWVRWKLENCVPIEKPAVSPEVYAEAMKTVKANATNKRLRREAMGSLALDFLHDGVDEGGDGGLHKLRAKERYQLPELASLRRKIQENDLEIDMPLSDATKAAAVVGKASNTWRALRIASRTKLALFDKIESYENIDVLFGTKTSEEDGADGDDGGLPEEEAENGTAGKGNGGSAQHDGAEAEAQS